MVDLNDVALFINVVKAGSFAEAGRRLGLPANTASRRVQALEGELGARLMQRSTRRLVLTDAGQRLFSQCSEQLEAVTQSALEVAEGNATPSGKVRVAAPADFFQMLSVELVNEFLLANPRVRLEFILSDARADLLGEGIDVAFRIGKQIEPNLHARQIGWVDVGLVASPDYIEAHGKPESLADLSEHDCIAAPTNMAGYTTWRLDGPGGVREIGVRGRFHVNSVQSQIRAALGGLGIALLPISAVREDLQAGRLMRILPDYGIRRVGLYFVFLERRQLPRAVSAFIEYAMAKIIESGMIDPLTPVKQAPA
ncbi:LysR family transcriptional regulator [Paraburkholderia sp. BR10954]|uniref:LysR family transcriptional regulator n=1 Tax=Paraburkholderia sp. BR10954 TaxID=3236995 RepID=UPI0034D3564F